MNEFGKILNKWLSCSFPVEIEQKALHRSVRLFTVCANQLTSCTRHDLRRAFQAAWIRDAVGGPAFQATVDVPDAEVVLDAVQSVAERVAFGARLGDRLRDAADDRRDDEDAEQVVDRHEGAFQLQDRVIHLAEGQGPQSRPKNQPRTSCSISQGPGGPSRRWSAAASSTSRRRRSSDRRARCPASACRPIRHCRARSTRSAGSRCTRSSGSPRSTTTSSSCSRQTTQQTVRCRNHFLRCFQSRQINTSLSLWLSLSLHSSSESLTDWSVVPDTISRLRENARTSLVRSAEELLCAKVARRGRHAARLLCN